MSPVTAGALAALSAVLGVLLLVSVYRGRRPGLVERVAPYVHQRQVTSTLLTAVAGGASGVSFADGCAGALVVSADGLNVVTVGAAPQCVVRARVGNLGDLVSNTFAVVGHGS